MDVVVVFRCDTNSYNAGPPVFMVVAANEEAAKRWIQEEVDGTHGSSHHYAQGKTADWWIELGVFKLVTAEIRS